MRPESPLDELEDADLVARALDARPGDHRAFDALVRRHRAHVITNCRYITRAPSEAEDLAQDVFVKAFFALDRFEGRAQFKTWVRRIKLNHCLNWLAKQKHRRTTDIETPGLEAAATMQVRPEAPRHDERQAIALALDALPDTLRLPLVMRDLDQLPYQDIADQLGLTLSAVKMRIKRGREQFRELYEGAA
ncbi:MAG: RNA polymerase sigma factor [Myxococcales bacterium]|nr:RNA polymerase sigma factor [Myxococcales bacterium]MCB9525919.1 RNA polymerase sigma factor [Myxococcales bacterium]